MPDFLGDVVLTATVSEEDGAEEAKVYGTTSQPEDDKSGVEKIIEEIGIGLFHWRVFFICGLFFFADIMEVMFLTYLKMAWKDADDVSSWWSAAIGTSVFCGMLFGASWWGFVADKFGRRVGLLLVALIISAFGLVSTFVPNVYVLVACRAMVGFGLGGSHIAVSLLMEMMPPKQRNNMLNLFQGFTVLGVWTEAALAWGVMEPLGWRYLAFLTSVPSFLAVTLIYWLPESPLWLAVAGRYEQSATILQNMARLNNSNVSIDAEKLRQIYEVKAVERKVHVKQLFSPSLWRSTILLWLIWFGDSMVYYGLMLITPDYLAQAGTGEIYRDMFVSVLAELPALLIASALIRIVGPPTAQAIFFSGCVALSLIIATIPDANGQAIAILITTSIRLFTSGSFYVTYTLTPSIYPTNVRGIGFGAGSSMSRIGGMITPFVANMSETSMLVPGIVYATTSTIGMLSGAALNWTTKIGKKSEVVPLLSNKDVD